MFSQEYLPIYQYIGNGKDNWTAELNPKRFYYMYNLK